jgi:HEAT repeat protein
LSPVPADTREAEIGQPSGLYSRGARSNEQAHDTEENMLQQMLAMLGAMTLMLSSSAPAQTTRAKSGEPVSGGRPLSEWIADLKGLSPQTRNAAAYEIAGMGPAAAAAVPALIEALDDPVPAVRFPVTIALLEIGPAAKAAVPRLQTMIDEEINDEIAASARRALRHIDPAAARSP